MIPPLISRSCRFWARHAALALLCCATALPTIGHVAEAQTRRKTASPPHAFTFADRQYHLVSTPVQRIVATLSDSYEVSHLQPRQWLIYAPDAPDTDDQAGTFSTLTIASRSCRATTWSELNPLGRKLLTARLSDSGADADPDAVQPADSSRAQARLLTSATYTALLFRRDLVPGAPEHPPAPLSPAQQALFTSPSETIDYDSPTFQAWLDSTRLRRGPGERDLDFALRVFRFIRAGYSYRYDLTQDRRASAICGYSYADCGGLSQLFVAALRASNIPAVALCGRIARTADWKASGQTESPGNVHVKSQFYASGIGWVPVEMSGAVYDRAAPDRAYFGRCVGDFLTLSVGNDQQLSLGDGKFVSQRGLQGIRFWVWGVPSDQDARPSVAVTTETASRWSVRQLPISTFGTQLADARSDGAGR